MTPVPVSCVGERKPARLRIPPLPRPRGWGDFNPARCGSMPSVLGWVLFQEMMRCRSSSPVAFALFCSFVLAHPARAQRAPELERLSSKRGPALAMSVRPRGLRPRTERSARRGRRGGEQRGRQGRHGSHRCLPARGPRAASRRRASRSPPSEPAARTEGEHARRHHERRARARRPAAARALGSCEPAWQPTFGGMPGTNPQRLVSGRVRRRQRPGALRWEAASPSRAAWRRTGSRSGMARAGRRSAAGWRTRPDYRATSVTRPGGVRRRQRSGALRGRQLHDRGRRGREADREVGRLELVGARRRPEPSCPNCAAYVSALAVFDDGSGPALYAGGRFTNAGSADGEPHREMGRHELVGARRRSRAPPSLPRSAPCACSTTAAVRRSTRAAASRRRAARRPTASRSGTARAGRRSRASSAAFLRPCPDACTTTVADRPCCAGAPSRPPAA